MKSIACRLSAVVCCLAMFAATATADGEELALYLKSGDILTGQVVKVDEDGIKLDIGEGIELFIRWSYTRGDKHFELRKSATDFNKLESVLKLADFCHEFAMDEQEAHVLVAALKLSPGHAEARDRLAKLPRVEGLEIPGEALPTDTPPDSTPDTTPDPKPDAPLPPPTRSPFKVHVKMTKADDAAAAWMIEQFEEFNYGIGTANDHEILVELTLDLKLERNPQFMGAELYAIYEGTLAYKLFRKGESSHFATATVKRDNIRRDTRDEARTRCRTELCEAAFRDIHKELEKLR